MEPNKKIDEQREEETVAVRELDEQALIEALGDTTIGTAGALQIEYKKRSPT